MQTRLAALCCACAALWSQPAIAQQHSRANPLDPRAETAATPYQSAFDSYRPLRDEKLRPWRDVNGEVAHAGGHVGIFGGAHTGQGAQKIPADAQTGGVR